MRFKKIIAFTVLADSISGVTFNTTAHAQEITNKDVSSIVEDNINPKIAGIFTVTAKSGANIQFVEKPPVKKAEGFCLLVVDKVWNT